MNRCSLYANIKISSSVTQTLLSTEIERIFNHLSRFFSKKSYSKGVDQGWQGDHRYQISRKFIFPPVFHRKTQVSQWPSLRSTVAYGWPPPSGVGSRAKGMAERKEKQAEEDAEEERETYTHTHTLVQWQL